MLTEPEFSMHSTYLGVLVDGGGIVGRSKAGQKEELVWKTVSGFPCPHGEQLALVFSLSL